MSIEIRELVIKGTIIDGPAEMAAQPSQPAQSAQSAQVLRDALLRECRQLVQNLLRERQER
jgi:hypothetical protein